MCTKAEDQSRQRKRSTGSLIIVWLDNIFEDESSFQAISISALQQAGHPVKTFTNINAFVDFSSDIENGKIIAVVSNEVCQTHLSFIHDLTQIISIFVIYQDNQMKNNERQKDLYKIHSVLNNATEIIDSLKRETKIIEHNLEHISILDCSAYKLDSNHLDYDFMYLHIFKELILEIDYDVEAKYDFIKYCHDYCLHDNPASVRVLEEMYEDYDKHSPILWYTKDTFLYRLVNRSLRDLNAMSIWNLRLFIKDVHQALESQGTIPVTVTTLFRGQSMPKENFERLKGNVGGLLAFNSFVSTSAEESVARSFILGIDENHPTLVAILFKIHVDTSMKTSSPFASVAHLSQMGEAEFLFSILPVFRIGEIHPSEDGIWHVQLTMTMDDDEQLRQLTEYIHRESSIAPACIDLEMEKTMAEIPQDFHVFKSLQNMMKFISIMARMGQEDDAQRIVLTRYTNYFGKDSLDSTNPMHSYENIKNFVERGTQWKSNVESHLQQDEDIRIHLPPSNKSDQTLDYHMNHFKLLQETGSVTALEFIEHYLRIGKIFFEQDSFDNALINYELALKKALELQQPLNPILGECYNQIGFVYQKLGDFEKALEYHQKNLDISYRSLPPRHPQLLHGHSLYATCLAGLNRHDEARDHFEKAMAIIRSYQGHEDLIEVLQQFNELYCQPRTNPVNSNDLNQLINRLENLLK